MKKRGNNNEVSSNRRFVVGASLLSVLSPDDHAVAATWVRPTREIGAIEFGAYALGLILACTVFAGANALTGEAQETPAGHRSAWQGTKLKAQVARVQWGSYQAPQWGAR